ncbi:hypothetical protein [Spirosoma endbachense]|uniref:Uncharacterized protein n=1 Tax=Spirosoma endbachense TaxID=2666025 RepID=A0A6P1W0W0_9BACT|nr:hypothetical protein [Spirosoma endbachense]QHV97316.1 hypothetical protein GJR95_20915 [Spirosoma endbachense]
MSVFFILLFGLFFSCTSEKGSSGEVNPVLTKLSSEEKKNVKRREEALLNNTQAIVLSTQKYWDHVEEFTQASPGDRYIPYPEAEKFLPATIGSEALKFDTGGQQSFYELGRFKYGNKMTVFYKFSHRQPFSAWELREYIAQASKPNIETRVLSPQNEVLIISIDDREANSDYYPICGILINGFAKLQITFGEKLSKEQKTSLLNELLTKINYDSAIAAMSPKL